MRSNGDILFLILGAVIYVWATVVFADYFMESLWQISRPGSLMIDPGAEFVF